MTQTCNSFHTANLVTFTEEILKENFIFCAVSLTVASSEVVLVHFLE